MEKTQRTICTLCNQAQVLPFKEKKFKWAYRRWLRCENCDLVFVREEDRPSNAIEFAEYQLHNNVISDSRYLAHLNLLTKPLLPFLYQKHLGLDYGSGPNPVLSDILGRENKTMTNYDPFFSKDRTSLNLLYDFVTCTEVAEHFFDPYKEFETLVNCLKPKGILGLMTSPRDPQIEFLDWPYIREKSHVSFYSFKTMDWLAEHFGLKLEFQLGSVWIWSKGSS